jgi:predicted porin
MGISKNFLIFLLFNLVAPSVARAETLEATREAARKLLVSRDEFHQWERHVRGFRREHNFSLSTGVSSGTWRVGHFGTVTDREFSTSGIFTRFQYSFHLQIYHGFGYLLGSSAGYHFESVDQRSDFRPVSGIMFPGVLAGLVYNFNPVFRLSLGADAYLERHNGIAMREDDSEEVNVSATMQTYDFGMFLDIFYDLAWALRLEGHFRTVEFLRPKDSEGFAVDANIKKQDRWVGVGMLYHLL